MWVVENPLGQLQGCTGRRLRAEGEQDPSLSCLPVICICCSLLATVFTSLHPLSPLFLYLVPPLVPIGAFHSLPLQHIHLFHTSFFEVPVPCSGKHTPPASIPPTLTFSFWTVTSRRSWHYDSLAGLLPISDGKHCWKLDFSHIPL